MSDSPQITIEILTLARQRRRNDWAVAIATIHSPFGTYSGHTVHNFNGYGRLSVEPARGSFLHEATKEAILDAYRAVTVGEEGIKV